MTFDAQPTELSEKAFKQVAEMVIEHPSFYVNKVYITYMKDGTMRIVFVDQDVDNNLEKVRTSVIMSPAGFDSLIDLIGKILTAKLAGKSKGVTAGENGEKIS